MANLPKKSDGRKPDPEDFSTRGHAHDRLARAIVSLSVTDTWPDAKCEWVLDEVYFADSDEPCICLCGHTPIRELCFIRNIRNGNAAVVGNVCVTRFIGLPAGKVFAGLRRIAKDIAKTLTPAAIEFAFGKRWINSWECSFLLDTSRVRMPSRKLLAKRAEIHAKVLRRVGRGWFDA